MTILTPWTEDEIARLRVHHAAGITFAEIAQRLAEEGFPKRTRNAVLGRANRLKLASRASADVHRDIVKRRERKAMAQPATVAKIQKARAGTLNQQRLAKLAKPAAPVIAEPVEPTIKGWPKPMTPTAVTLWSLKPQHCRMPLWADDATDIDAKFYCGAPREVPSSYCRACIPATLGMGTPGERNALRELKRRAA